MNPVTKFNILIVVGLFVALASAIFMACFGAIFNSLLNNMLVIDPEGKIFDTFTSPSTPIYLDFYMFNVTNTEDVQHYGAKPNLTELGPYKYKETLTKHDYNWSDADGTVEYKQRTTYVFDAENSNGTESDVIITLNAVMVIVGALSYENKLVRRFIWPEIESGMDLFEPFTVSELLFEGWDLPAFDFDFSAVPGLGFTEGVNGTLYDILLSFGHDVPFLEANKIGLFYGKNGADDGVYRVKTGALGMDEYLQIQTWNNDTEVHFWNTTECNMINGTDGTQYPPGLQKGEVLRMFTTDLCRSLSIEFEKEVQLHNTTLYRFILPKSVLQITPETMCFCKDKFTCKDSMVNVRECKKGAPIVLSTPHFYQGDQEAIDAVIGLNPQKELHETYLDIEPTTGVVMEAAKNIQMNLPLKKYGKLPAFMNVPEVIFPIFWASENAQIQAGDAEKLNKALTMPFVVVYSLCGVIVFIGVILTLTGVIKARHHKANFPKEVLIHKK